MKRQNDLLPERLEADLAKLGREIANGRAPRSLLERILGQFDALQPGKAIQADRHIANLARLYWSWHHKPVSALRLLGLGAKDDSDLLHQTPELERVFIFHGDGHLREDALNKLDGDLRSPFVVAAVTYRLNDWVREVRLAARRCVVRTLPKTSPEAIAGAARDILVRRAYWGRWSSEEAAVMSAAFGRPDAVEKLANLLAVETQGPLGRIMRAAMREAWLDPHLLRLARDAVAPPVRAIAVEALINGCAQWTASYEQFWIDKVYGKAGWRPVFAVREITRPAPIEQLIDIGVGDPSAAVPKITADALIRHRSDLPNVARWTEMLAHDHSGAVRARIDFLVRTLVRERTGSPA